MRYRRVIKNNPCLAIYLFNREMGVTGGDVTGPVATPIGLVERDAEVEHEFFLPGEGSMGPTIDEDIHLVQPGIEERRKF